MGRVESFISAKVLSERIQKLGQELKLFYEEKNPLLLGVLNGSFMFLADISRAMAIPMEIDFVRLKSYSGTQSSGQVSFLLENHVPIKGRHVLVLEDIVDTGLSMSFLKGHLLAQQPASLKICCLLHKPTPENRKLVDYSGFEIGQEFVVGFGLDHEEKYRYLPFVGRYHEQ